MPGQSEEMKNRDEHINLMLRLVAAAILCVIAQVAYTGSAQAPRLEKINRLLEAASIKSPSIPVPEEIRNSKDWEKRRQYFEQRSLRFQQVEAKREQARNELAAMGEEIIDPLLEIYRRGKFRSNIILVLKKIAAPKAKVALLDISLERNGLYNLGTLAARSYIELAENKEDIEKLLLSNDEDVLAVALQNLPGVKVDAELLKRLSELLQSSTYHPVLNYSLRIKAAAVIVADIGNAPIREKVFAIVDSLDTVEQMPKSNERLQYDRVGTFADQTYWLLARSLEKMKGAGKYLSEATERLTGNPRRWVQATRANRGDSSVKHQLREILEDPNMLERTLLRSYVLRGYGKIGTPKDFPFLHSIAQSDPVVLLDRGGPLLETINGRPINNSGERAVIYDEFTIHEWERLSPRQRRPFIREEAQRAIRAIQSVIVLRMDGSP